MRLELIEVDLQDFSLSDPVGFGQVNGQELDSYLSAVSGSDITKVGITLIQTVRTLFWGKMETCAPSLFVNQVVTNRLRKKGL